MPIHINIGVSIDFSVCESVSEYFCVEFVVILLDIYIQCKEIRQETRVKICEYLFLHLGFSHCTSECNITITFH